MYDYLGGEQVKLFYVPIFSKGSTRREEAAHTWHSGGRMRSFGIGDELPLQTLYYKYPNNFMIVDFRFDEKDIWIIKDGKLQKQTTLSELREEDIVTPAFTTHGGEVHITTMQDFYDFQTEREEFRKQTKEIELKYFPNGSLHMIRENLSEYESKNPLREQEQQALEEGYYDKWFPKNTHEEEKNFGEAITCYIRLKERQDDPPLGSLSPKKDYEACLAYVKEMIEKNSSIVDNFKTWLDNENLLKEIDFSSLLQDFQ